MADRRTRAFVCGHPVAHSRSPLIHGYWLKTLGLTGEYVAVDVAPSEFDPFIRGLEATGYAGGNVTIPHKEAAFAATERIDEPARIVGAINTVWLEDGRLCGTNTDWSGFSANLDARAPQWSAGGTAVVLGAGGSARAIVHALSVKGYREIRVVNRSPARARELADRFGPKVTAHGWAAVPELLADADLLVNTTPLGMAGDVGESIDLTPLRDHAVVTDIVYVPLITPLLAAARARGLTIVDGLGMLLHQAVPGFERWFRARPCVTEELRTLVVADMDLRK